MIRTQAPPFGATLLADVIRPAVSPAAMGSAVRLMLSLAELACSRISASARDASARRRASEWITRSLTMAWDAPYVRQAISLDSICIASGETNNKSHHKNFDVEKYRPVLHILDIIIYSGFHVGNCFRLAAQSIDLRPARETWFYAMSRKISADHF